MIALPVASLAGSLGPGIPADLFILQLGFILLAARLVGGLCHRLRIPRVVGEIGAGILFGPFALGGLSWGPLGPLFPPIEGVVLPVSGPLHAIAVLASVLLLFHAGLETDLRLFLRYSVAGTAVGIGGVVFSFGLGAWVTVAMGGAEGLRSPEALFMGALSTATSVGVTARILAERRKTTSPEGVTIMAAAVLDDILGILLVAVVVGASAAGRDGERGVDGAALGILALKVIGFWLVVSAAALLGARRISQALKRSRNPAAICTMAFGLALMMAGVTERAGLAMIIGAYMAGLAASRTDLVGLLRQRLDVLIEFLVPAFFFVSGMMVDLHGLGALLAFGGLFSLAGFLSKVLGCAIPAWLMGFRFRGGVRIGLGMLPRGEVALIIAGLGLSSGVLDARLFGVAMMMTLLTTVAAPMLLPVAFLGGSGRRDRRDDSGDDSVDAVRLDFFTRDVAELVILRLIRAFRQEEFFVSRLETEGLVYQLLKDNLAYSLAIEGTEVVLRGDARFADIPRLVMVEELLEIRDMLQSVRSLDEAELHAMETRLLTSLFGRPAAPSEPDA